jgi:hypothetical protein
VRAGDAPSTRALRGWQRRALVRYLTAKPRDFLLVATPGAGTTAFALRIAAELLADRSVDTITVVVPTEHLKTQWAMAAAADGIALDPKFRNTARRSALPPLRAVTKKPTTWVYPVCWTLTRCESCCCAARLSNSTVVPATAPPCPDRSPGTGNCGTCAANSTLWSRRHTIERASRMGGSTTSCAASAADRRWLRPAPTSSGRGSKRCAD